MSKKTHKVIFVDTNIFLHFKLFTDIDWLSVAGASSATIVMPPVLMGELDKHKYTQKNESTKKRAEKVTKKLAEFYRTGQSVQPNVSIRFVSIEPTKEFEENRLSRESQDDQLLASILLYKAEHPDEDVVLITNDLSLEVRAGYHKIETLGLSDELRRASEQDPNEKKVKELEQQIREYQRRIPDLKLRFPDGADFIKFPMPSKFIPQEVAEMMDELKRKYPKLTEPKPPETKRKIKASDLAKSQKEDSGEQPTGFDINKFISMKVDRSYLDVTPAHEIKRYNEELDEFYEEYEKYFVAFKRKKEFQIRTLLLKIELTNDGNTPGEDIDVYMKFPADLNVSENVKYSLPKIPKQPEPAKTNREVNYHRSYLGLSRDYLRSQIYIPPLNRVLEPPNVTRNSIRHTAQYHEVSFRVRKLKHGHYILSKLYVSFGSLEKAHSFTVDYQVTAGNVPNTINGALHIRIERDDSLKSIDHSGWKDEEEDEQHQENDDIDTE